MSAVKFIWTSHPRFPLPPLASSSTTAAASLSSPAHLPNPTPTPTPSSLHISLLDSSFNPPTLAHFALASHPSPPALPPYQAHILALSAKNVDKPGADARSVELRLEMMRRTAEEMVRRAGVGAGGVGMGNVGVILLEEPTFVGKSTRVKEALDERIREVLEKDGGGVTLPEVRLTFVIGWDTLVRVFAPKYYPSPAAMRATLAHFFDSEGSSFSCARRGDVPPEEEEAYLAGEEVKPWVDKGLIDVWSLDEGVAGASSTEVRRRVKAGEGVEGLVLEGVREVVEREGLYRD